MIIQLINMNTNLRMYPVEGSVAASPDVLISLGPVILVVE
jgi:hypothetical protein